MKYFTKDHEWVIVDGDEAIIGISAHAAEELGDLTYVELPEVGADVIVGDTLGSVESVKAASDIYAPISGTVMAVNTNLEDDPSILNQAAETDGWICRLENIDLTELDELMSEDKYMKFIQG